MHHCEWIDQLYNDTLNFVPTMEVSGNEKAKNVKYLPFMIVQIQPIEIQ